MPSSSAVGIPAEWSAGNPKRFIPGVIIVGLLGVASLITIPAFLTLDKPGGIKYSVSFTVLFLTIAVYGFWTRVRQGRATSDVTVGEIDGLRATRIRYSRMVFGSLVVLLLALSAISVSAALDFYRAMDTGGVAAAPAGAVIAAVAAVFFLLFPIQVILGRIRRGSISLTKEGIHHRGWTFNSFLPWSAFAGVKAAYHSTAEVLVIAYQNTQWKARRTALLWNIEKPPPVPMIDINCSYFDTDPSVLLHVVKFYVENPNARAELGTEASVVRASQRNFGPGTTE